MKSRIPPPESTNRVVLLLAIVCLFATFTGVILVGAHSDDNTSAATDQLTAAQQNAAAQTRIAEQFGQLPLSFEINKGQIDEPVKFLSHGAGYDLFLTATEAVLRVQKPPAQQTDKSKPPSTVAEAAVREGTVLRLRMLGANATPLVEGQEELPGKIHYITGNDPAKWHRNIPIYKRAYFKDVYPGIDVVYYGNQRELEYDYVIAAGANPKLIRFTVDGAEKVQLDKAGRLQLNLKHGEVYLNKPVIYQVNENGSRDEVKGTYVIKGNEVRFKLERFDSSKPLIIDPVLSYSTLLGSSNNDQALGIAVDSDGNAYVTGSTDGTNFPTTAGSFKATSNRSGAFITKLNPTGTALVYSTYITGEGTTTGSGIAVDSSGNAHITGTTSARDFPIVNGLKTTSNFFKTSDAAANWNNQNSGLVGDVGLMAVAPNAPNTIYAVTSDGLYRSTDAGTTWAKATANGGVSPVSSASAFAVDPTNSSTVFISIFSGLFKSTDGGNNFSSVSTIPLNFFSVSAIVFDPATPSTMYVGAGNGVFKSTDSGANWVTQNNFNVPGTPNVRALAIDPTAPLTIYAGTSSNGLFKSTNGGGVWTAMNTGMGGPNPTSINAIAIDPSNTATLYTGHTFSGGINKSTNGGASWTPLTNEVPQGTINAMVATSSAVYAAVGSVGIIKSTNGGTNWSSVNSGLWSLFVRTLVVRPNDSSVLYAGTGSTFSNDAFALKLNAAGSGVLFSTLLGGSSDETGNGIAVDGSGNIYVAGQTSSLNFPTANAVQSAVANDFCSAYVTKLNPTAPSYVFSTYLRGSQCERALSVAVDSSSNVYVTGTTSSNDFLIANAFQPNFGGPQFSDGDAFVTKLTGNGALVYSTYLGGSSTDTGFAITADSSGNAYITGVTNSTNFPTSNPIQATNGNGAGGFNSDVFVTKLSDGGGALVFSTYLGGGGFEQGRGIAIDSANNVYITGSSDSSDFPLVAGALRTKSALYKSTDGAANWTNDNYGFQGAASTNFGSSSVTALAVVPSQPSIIYAGSNNGVFKSSNGGRTWSAMNTGLTNRNVTALVINPSAPNTLYITVSGFGGATGVYKSTNGGSSWNLRNTGIIHNELLSLAIDPVTPDTLYLGVAFCCVTGSHIYKTTNGADNWAPVAGAPPLGPQAIVIDPLNHASIYVADSASTTTIYKSPDAGATWQNLVFTSSTTSSVRSVAVSPITAGLLYASTDQALFKSVDGGTSWTQIPSLSGKIVFDPVSASTAYLLTNPFAFNPQGLFKSTDNGQTWTPVNKGLNTPQAVALAIDPTTPSTLYLASTAATGTDAFVTKINSAGSALVYSTFLGGPGSTQCCSNTNSNGFGIAVDSAGNAYVSGLTGSTGFQVTPDSYQPFNRGFNDAFIAKLGNSYIISGRVLNNGNPASPLAGAEVVLSDGASLTSVFTGSDGTYQFSRLREGGNFTVSASLPHFTITPASQSFSNLNSDQVLDFSALTSDAEFHTISGQITENGVPVPSVTVTLSGSQSGLRSTDSNGNYSFTLIAGGNYTVTPSAVGFNFDPVSQTFNALSSNQTANFAAIRQSFVVTNENNHGPGSFRDAILNANATPGRDTITFNIPGAGVKTINLLIPLPDITDRVVIDATTQPGYAGTPLIELNGSATGNINGNNGNGLVIKAGGSTVRGLAIGNFGTSFGNGAGIWLNACDNNIIQANYIGIAADGTTMRTNSRGILLTNSSNNLIGGTSSATRNVISGNSNGIEITGNANVVQGNFIGTNATGTAAVRNNTAIAIFNSTSIDNVIGGTAAGAGNLISGNSTGISTSGNGAVIQGNLIGTDVSGTTKIPNSSGIQSSGLNTLIGGLTPGARNIISGNQSDGVSIRGAGSKLQGNYVGTDITGTLALGNGGNGVVATEGTLIGGTESGARNIISANGNFGNVVLGFNSFGNATPTTVQGNYIGTDVTGTRGLGGSAAGINILTSNHTIGGVVDGARNVVSGNAIGIQIGGSFSGSVGNVIKGNYIGLNAAGTGPLPNTNQGIAITDATNNTIGGIEGGAGNTIAFNGGPGLTISTGTANSIRRNSIFSNTGLGIDLGINGVTVNDSNDSDTGANQLQNFPVITSVTTTGNSTTVQGSLKSIPSTSFDIDFYSNASVDPSGNGEGAQFFGAALITTDGNGDATFSRTFPIGLATGRVITATATDPNGNTSEFSAADATAAIGSLHFTMSSIAAIEDVGTLPVTVLRTGGTTGTLTVNYATTNGTAIAGQDYTSTSGTLTFAAGETSKTIQVPILDDSTTEADETFTLSLSDTPSLESLGAPNSLVITVQDRTTVPSLLISNQTVPEGNTGSTTDALFIVNLSAATGRTVSLNFATQNQGAFGGAKCGANDGIDYVSASGTFSFPAGSTAFAVAVKICGDTSAEANESLRLALTNVTGAIVPPNQGFVTIIDDDVLNLLLDESGPSPSQLAALEAVLHLRDPFTLSMPDWFTPGVNENTRVKIFAQGLILTPGEQPNSVFVILQASNFQFFSIPAEDVRPMPNSDFTQVTFQLPNTLSSGTCTVTIFAHGRQSNSGTFRIAP